MIEPEPDAARFRQVVGHFTSGVTVVTSIDGDPLGLAVSSFMSVSLNPPLVAVCVRNESTTWPRVRQVGGFCVNVLAYDQELLCRRFSMPGTDRFADLQWHHSPAGYPVPEGVLAYVDCAIEDEFPGGDHAIVVGRVTSLEVMREALPLVYFRGGYGHFAS